VESRNDKWRLVSNPDFDCLAVFVVGLVPCAWIDSGNQCFKSSMLRVLRKWTWGLGLPGLMVTTYTS
jgi:hypothetical protein